jgi:hypothetical protein
MNNATEWKGPRTLGHFEDLTDGKLFKMLYVTEAHFIKVSFLETKYKLNIDFCLSVEGNFHIPVPSMNRLSQTVPAAFSILSFLEFFRNTVFLILFSFARTRRAHLFEKLVVRTSHG